VSRAPGDITLEPAYGAEKRLAVAFCRRDSGTVEDLGIGAHPDRWHEAEGAHGSVVAHGDPVGCMCLRLSPRACPKCLALFVWVKRAHDVHGWLWVHAMRGLGTSSSDGEHDAWRAERGRTMCEATQSPQEVALGGMRRPRIPFQRFGARRGRSNINNNNNNACPSRYRAWRRF